MDNIEERAKKFADNCAVGDAAIIVDLMHSVAYDGYIAGATEQKKIDSDEFKKLVVWKLGSAHDAYVRSKPQDESYTKGKFDALDELYKELFSGKQDMKRVRIVGELDDNGYIYWGVQLRRWHGWAYQELDSVFLEKETPSIECAERTLRKIVKEKKK